MTVEDRHTRREPTRRRRLKPTAVIRKARAQFGEITGREVESISSLNRSDGGWELHVEVVELARIPDTTSIMGTYRVRLDEQGSFVGYERLRRYPRGRIEA